MPIAHKIPESVLVVIHTRDLDVLLIERADKPGFWQSVTGSRDCVDEPFIETAAREVQEETGIVIDTTASACDSIHVDDALPSPTVPIANLRDWGLVNVYEIYPVWRHRYAPGITHNTEHVFGLLVPRSIPISLAPQEHIDYVWLPYREAADRCFSPSNAEAILQLPRHIGN